MKIFAKILNEIAFVLRSSLFFFGKSFLDRKSLLAMNFLYSTWILRRFFKDSKENFRVKSSEDLGADSGRKIGKTFLRTPEKCWN